MFVGFCSIVGGTVVISGLYMLLWGKESDKEEQVTTIEHQYITHEVDQEDPKKWKEFDLLEKDVLFITFIY